MKNSKLNSIKELINYYGTLSKLDKIEDILLLNSHMNNIYQNDIEIDKDIKIIIQENDKMEKNIFNWRKEHEFIKPKFKIIEFFDSLENEILIDYFNPKLFQKIFSYKIIYNYLKEINRDFGKKYYDDVLRFQTKLSSCLIKFHIKYDFRKRPFINTKWISNINPFLRIKIRNFPICNEIEKKYNGKEGLIKFINLLFKNYFPKVSWRWVGTGHFVHLNCIKWINLLFMYGIFEKDDIIQLLVQLNSKTEIIIKLEDSISRDFEKFGKKFKSEVILVLTSIKKHFSSILIQIYMLFNDEYIKSLYPFLNYKEDDSEYLKFILKIKNFKGEPNLKKFKQCFFFINYDLFIKSTQIILNYLGRELNFIKEYSYGNNDLDKIKYKENKISFKIYLKMLILFVSNSTNDPFISSIRLVDKNYLSYLLEENKYLEINIEIEKLDIKIQQLKDNIINNNYELNFLNSFAYKKYLTEILLAIDYLIKNRKKNYNLNYVFNKISEKKILDNFLSIISISSNLKGNEIIDELITLSIFYLKEFNVEYFSNQSIIFKGNSLKYLINLMKKKDIQIIIFMEGIFKSNNYFLFINKYIIDYCFEQFMYYKKKMMEDLKSNNNLNDLMESLISLVAFVKLFENFIINRKDNIKLDLIEDKPIDLMIQFVLHDLIDELLRYIVNNNLIVTDNYILSNYSFKIKNKDSYNLIKLSKEIDNLDLENKKLLFWEFFYSYLRLFNITCERIYIEKVFNIIKINMNQFLNIIEKLESNIVYTNYIKEIYKTFNLFIIFSGNHLLNDRTKINKGVNLYNEDHLKNLDYNLINKIITNMMNFIINKKDEFNKVNKFNLVSFIKKAFLPLIYKLINGIISLLLPKDNIKNGIFIVKFSFDLLVKNYPIIYKILKDIDNIEYKKSDGIKLKGKLNTIEEQTKFPELTECRRICNQIISLIEHFYNKHEFYTFLSEYKYSKTSNSSENQLKQNFTVVNKNAKFKSLINNALKAKTYSNLWLKYFYFIKKYYVFKKNQYINNRDKNIFLKIINDESIHNKGSLNIFINYLFNLLNNNVSEISVKVENNDLDSFSKNYLVNDDYITVMIIFNNIINICHEMRFEIYSNYEIENNKDKYLDAEGKIIPENKRKFDKKKITNSLKMIYQIFEELIYFTSYKVFKNKIWNQIFILFQYTSEFFKNLMENNFMPFKLEFNKYKPNSLLSKTNTLFFSYYIFMEVLGTYSDLYKNKDKIIILSDREECFSSLIIMVNGISEFINGPCKENQLVVYRYRIDIWVGIFLREIYDVDHEFFEVKYSVLNYLSSLIEGENVTVIEFMVNNFYISDVFNHMISLIKLLYVREHLIIKKSENNKPKYSSGSLKKIELPDKNKTKIKSKCTEEDCKKYQIIEIGELIHIYKTSLNTFSNHIIIQIVINMYKFIKDMAKINNNCDLFIIEKNKILEKFLIDKKIKNYNWDSKDLNFNAYEELIIFNFIQEITLVADVRENENTIKNEIVFQKLPRCFLLTNDTKEIFIENTNVIDTNSKHISIMDNYKIFDIECEYNLDVYKNNIWLFILTSNDSFIIYQWILYLLSLIMNMWGFVSFRFDRNSNLITLSIFNKFAIDIWNYIVIVFSFILILFWFLTKYKLYYLKEKEYYLRKNINKKLKFFDKLDVYFFKSILYNIHIMAFFFHFLFGILYLTGELIFLSLHILLIINLSKLMRHIVKAIYINFNQFFLSIFLAIIIIFSYSIILLDNFSSDANSGFEKNVCTNMIDCYLNTINYGLRFGGGIAEKLSITNYYNADNSVNINFFTRFLYDMSFFFLINIIFLNIIQGIIVDTFANSRDEQRERIHLVRNFCFVCGEKKESLEKYGLDFETHNTKFHDIWKYIYLIIYLRNKDQLSMTGLEYKIYSDIIDKKTFWLPNKYISLKNKKNKKKEESNMKKFKMIHNKLDEKIKTYILNKNE